jgi:hypothetical protein
MNREFQGCRQHNGMKAFELRFAAQPPKKSQAVHTRHIEIDNNRVRQIGRQFAAFEGLDTVNTIDPTGDF